MIQCLEYKFALIFILLLHLFGSITNTKQGILEIVDVLSRRSQRGGGENKNNFSSSVGIEVVLFLNRKPQNIVEVYPQTVLAPLLLELVTQCPMCPSILYKEGV